MRRFVEEIRVQDPMIAEKIIMTLEKKSDDKRDPVYEVDMYDREERDPLSNSHNTYPVMILKIFVREGLVEYDQN